MSRVIQRNMFPLWAAAAELLHDLFVIWVNWTFKLYPEQHSEYQLSTLFFPKLRECLVTTRRFSTLLLKSTPGDEAWAGRAGGGNDSRDFSNTVRRPPPPAWSEGTRMSILTPLASECGLVTATNPPCGTCVFSSHTHTHTQHPSLCTPIVPSAGQSRLRIIQLLRHVIVCMYTFKVCTTHTHTHKVHGTFCVAPVLSLSGSPVSAAGGYSPPPLLSLVQWHSVGAGRDGFVQLQVQGSRAELQAAVAGLTDAAGLEQLLAWHWDLLVTAAGTEHVTAVPAGRNTKVTAGLSDRASLHLMLPCVSSLHLHQGLFFRHEQLCELDRIVIHLIKVWISNLFNADQELSYNLQKWKLTELIWMIF